MISAGLYVHVPFCLTRCGYCDFNTYAGLDHLARPYLDAVLEEAELARPQWTDAVFVSIFLGGGTPTMLAEDELRTLLARLRTFSLGPDLEVTAEANPDTVDERYLAALAAAGVTRVSLGAQSFDPVVLRALERVHSPESVRRAYSAARRAGLRSLNLDLIYGAEGETLASWRRTLREAIEMGPEHISCYALTIEPATPLGRKVAAGLAPPPDPDLQTEMYEHACEALALAGYLHYEVSNWARPGCASVHNIGYWEGRPYLGLGAGAHSYRDGERWWNLRPPRQYIDAVVSKRLPIGGRERLDHGQKRLERLLLGLRAAEGVPLDAVSEDLPEWLFEHGLARRREGRLKPTERGMFLANDLVLALVDDG